MGAVSCRPSWSGSPTRTGATWRRLYDDSVPLPPGADSDLSPTHPRLQELRDAYAALDVPATLTSRWDRDAVDTFFDLRYFRGETLVYWHYRELPRIDSLKFFLFARHVRSVDTLGLLDTLTEDGAFGCWTYRYADGTVVSRDLLESASELLFLDQAAGVASRPGLRVLDIGAGYGRLAHRAAEALPDLADWCCVDAVPESTFVSEYYLAMRGRTPPARVVRLDRLRDEVEPGGFDLAVNIHSWPECPEAAVRWWVDELRAAQGPPAVRGAQRAAGTAEPGGRRHAARPDARPGGGRLPVDRAPSR